MIRTGGRADRTVARDANRRALTRSARASRRIPAGIAMALVAAALMLVPSGAWARTTAARSALASGVSARFGVSADPDSSPVGGSAGTDFWLSFESNCTFDSCGPTPGPGMLYVFISGEIATTGTVTVPGISFSQAFSVTPGKVTTVRIPSTAEDDLSDQATSDGVHVVAGAPVSVYGLNQLEYSTDGFLGLPTQLLGTSYLVEGYDAGFGSQFSVVGTQNGTTVTITPSEEVAGSHQTYPKGQSYQVSLDQGEVYQLVDQSSGDLSGTSITSSAPVAVFAGNDCADVPDTYQACNTLAEEMTPISTWGTDFWTEPFFTRNVDTFRVLASEAGTTVSFNGYPLVTLDAGQEYEVGLNAPEEITANHPIQVMQYSNGQNYDSTNSDPFDISIPPTSQWLDHYTVSTPPEGVDPAITRNYLNIIAPTSEVGSIDLDGSAIPADSFSQTPGTSYSAARLTVGFGSHALSGPLPFELTEYGYGQADGYGYPGGLTVTPVGTASDVSAAAAGSSSNPTGTKACVNAWVTDGGGTPLDDVDVAFAVTGANPGTGDASTGSGGVAQFCYSGANPGQDSVLASAQGLSSVSVGLVWTAGQASTSLSTSLSGGDTSGTTVKVPPGTAVTDQATVTGTNAASATGSVTYSVYSDSSCTKLVAGGTAQSITTPGTLPASTPASLAAGTYYWQATYSGDSSNHGSTSTCGSEVETVTKMAGSADLSVTESAPVWTDQYDFSVKVTVINNGPDTAKTIVTGLFVPKAIEILGPNGVRAGHSQIWTDFRGLAPGQSVTFQAQLENKSDAPGTGTFTAGTLSLSTSDPNDKNNLTSESFSLTGPQTASKSAARLRPLERPARAHGPTTVYQLSAATRQRLLGRLSAARPTATKQR